MATDATGTPTTKGIPTFNVNIDAPSGLGSNAQMAAIDSLLSDRVQASNETLIANKLLSADIVEQDSRKLLTR